MKKAFLNKCYAYAIWVVALSFVFITPAVAATEVDEVLRNITTSSELLPGLLRAGCYLFGLLLGVTAIFKLKEHVDNPTQVPLRTPIIRALIGGTMFSLPIVTRAVWSAYNGGTADDFNPHGPMGGAVSALLGGLVGRVSMDFNMVLRSIRDSFADAPGFISAGTYMLGLLLTVSGLIKIKEHVERPEQTELREGVVRLLTAGALFAIPTIYQAVYNAIGANSLAGSVSSILQVVGTYISFYDLAAPCNPLASTSLGDSICGIVTHAGALPAFLTATGYMIGLVLAVWGVLKIKAHVLNPMQTPLHEGIMRLLAAGAFFSLPALAQVARATLGSTFLEGFAGLQATQTFTETTMPCTGLDGVVYCMMQDVFAPVHVVVNFFCICAGTILIMIGISRLIKSAQDGPRGPGGFGTFMTFAAGGALIASNELMRAATATLFTSPLTDVHATLEYTTGMTTAELQHAHTVISAIVRFMILVGIISFVRGIFIVREVAEGNQQASMMAGLTHIIGGALAVNLGPLINAVENTLGIVGFGINFT
jgi:hypothetical protein